MIRWGILGCGDVAEKKSGPALYKADGSELVAVMRRDRAKAEDFARRHHAKRAYDTVESLLSDPDVDAVYVATPPALHLEHTIAAAEAGKHVLVEKPMAVNANECEAMIRVCRDAGVHLHVAYYRRFYPKFVAAKAKLDAGVIGRVLGARLLMCARSGNTGWRVDPAQSGGGHFVDVGSHRLDMLCFLLGEPIEYRGFAANLLGHHRAENDAVLAIQFASGAVASASFHFHTQPGRDVLEVYGEAGTLTIDPFDGQAFSIGGETFAFDTPDPVHLPFVQALVRVYNGDPIPHVDGETGAAATRIMDAVLSGFRAARVA